MKKKIYGLEIRLCVLFIFLGCFCLPLVSRAQTPNLPPEANCRDLTLELNSMGYVIITADDVNSGSHDNEDGMNISMTIDRDYFNCSSLFDTYYVTLTVTDQTGLSSTCTSEIHVEDNIPPVAKCKDEIDVYLTGGPHPSASIDVSDIDDGSTDNCAIVSKSLSQSTFSCSDAGTQYVELYVSDGWLHGNDYCYTIVNVIDQPPVVICNDYDVQLDEWGFAEIYPWDVATFYDDCGLPLHPVTLSESHFSCFNQGEHDIIVTVEDENNHTSTCISKVTVADLMNPVAKCKPVTLTLDENGIAQLNIEDLDDGSTDNCGGPFQYTIVPDKTTFTCEDLGPNPVTLFVIDRGFHADYCYTAVWVEDHITPQIICGTELFFPNDMGDCGAHIDPILPQPTVIESCDYTLDNNSTGSFGVGSHTVTWYVEDEWGNDNWCNQTITVVDAEPPTIVCPPDIVLSTDAGSCDATLSEADLGEATAYDNCGYVELTNNFLDLFVDGKIPFGENYVTYTAKDLQGNTAICNQLINVNKVVTITEVSVTPGIQQYSDPVTLWAQIDPGVCDIAGQAATHVTFYINNQPMGPPVELNQTGQLLWAEATYDLIEYEGYEGYMNPDVNPKLVKASFSGLNENFIVDNPNTNLTVTHENACASYAGVLFASTGGVNSSQAIVTLAATVIEEADGHTNDLLNYAMLQFYNGINPVGPPVQLGWVTEGDKTIGTAMYEWPVDIGNANGITYSISAEVIGYYANGPGDCWASSDVTVSKPLGEFITGGGYLLLENSAGIKSGDAGTKNSFGFNVKFTKKLTSLQGNINTTFRRTEDGKTKVFNAKGTAFTSLAVVNNYAVFTGKAVIKNITDPLYPFDEEGNAIMQMSMTDNGDGTMDLLGITLWNKKGGLWFSSNWNGKKTVDQLLAAGNLVIHKSQVKSAESIEIISDISSPGLKVYPNPFSEKLRFEFVSPESVNCRIDMYDMTGRLVKNIFEQPIEGGVSYEAGFRPEAIISGMYFYRVQMGEATYNGKVVFKK